MAYFIILGITLALLVGLFLWRKPANAIQYSRAGRWLAWIGLFLLGVQAIFWFGIGAGEIAAGTTGGAMHLLPGVAFVLMIFLLRKIPLEGGMVLAFQGIALAVYILVGTNETMGARMISLLATSLPAILIGLLFLWACGLSLKKR